jgi:peptidoglycan/LPS O-acetylase OafA/YrhL
VNARAGRFPLFDSLRAIAALAVLGTHAAVYAASPGLMPYAARLEVGVAIFFVISGFLLYRPFVRARLLAERPPRLRAYAWRRALRIVPNYWVALTVTTIVLGTAGVFTLSDGPLYYGFAQTWTEPTIGGGLSQAWTLCIEVTFYAFLPIWAWAMRRAPGASFERRMRGELLALALVFAGSIAYKILLLAGGNQHQIRITPALDSLPGFLDQFAIGMGLAVLTVWLERRERLPRPLAVIERFPILPWLVAGVAFWAASTQIGLTGRVLEDFTPREYVLRHLLYALIALGMVLPAVVGDSRRGIVRRVLANPALLFLGLISYSIYLYGPAVLDQLQRWHFHSPGPAYAGLLLVGGVITIAVSAVSYYLVERPALSLKRLVPPDGIPRGEAIAEPAPATVAGAREG